jgi:hypothetical protein
MDRSPIFSFFTSNQQAKAQRRPLLTRLSDVNNSVIPMGAIDENPDYRTRRRQEQRGAPFCRSQEVPIAGSGDRQDGRGCRQADARSDQRAIDEAVSLAPRHDLSNVRPRNAEGPAAGIDQVELARTNSLEGALEALAVHQRDDHPRARSQDVDLLPISRHHAGTLPAYW